MITNEKEIRKRIAEAIQQSGKNQTQIAKEIGVSQQTVSCYKNKTKTPKLEIFAKLCEATEITPNDILEA